MSDIVLAHEVPKRALMAMALGMQAPDEVLRIFDYTDTQIAWLLNDPTLAKLVEGQRHELEKSGAVDAARVRMHAIAQMELCTKRSNAGMLREVDVKFLDTLLRSSPQLTQVQKEAAGPATPTFSIQFNINRGGRETTTIDVTPTREISELVTIELPSEEFS